MTNSFQDLETYCATPIKDGTHRYAEGAEVMLWSYATDDGPVAVWDLCSSSVWVTDDLTDELVEQPLHDGLVPPDLVRDLRDPDTLIWFQNGGNFDMPVLRAAQPALFALVAESRWRDTMVQAYAHALPGSLDKLGAVMGLAESDRKLKEGRALVLLFCKPRPDGSRATRATHPAEWRRFVAYAGGDITTMRAAHRKMPMWNYGPKEAALWHLDLRTNQRGFAVDLDLARCAVAAADSAQKAMAKQAVDMTDGAVSSATRRDAMLAHILSVHGVELPDMRADTLERRLDDPDLPDAVKDLLRLRLQASMNSVSKFKTLLRGVSSDGRLRGTMQFRGAGRTGRAAHRLFQPGNLPRGTIHGRDVDDAIAAIKAGALDLVVDKPMEAISSCIRGAIVAAPGKKLVIADLSNIEGRMAAWLAGEEWKLQAFRDFDAGTGPDLYIVAYARAFNVDPASVPKKGLERQIGKVMELMLQYGGGVSAFLTGAATYGIDLVVMADAAWDTIPARVKDEAQGFLDWLYGKTKDTDEARLAARHGLTEKVFIACDSLKRLWREAHPAISSYWRELEDACRAAIHSPGETFECRRLCFRRDGSWLRVRLPSGRVLCYPNPGVDDDNAIFYTGFSQYTKQWGKVSTYSGKLYENVTQAASADQLFYCMPPVEAEGYLPVLHVHDEIVSETPDTPEYTVTRLAELMCADLGWNAGLPLAAAGFETYRYKKE